jgi:hypothetical protein
MSDAERLAELEDWLREEIADKYKTLDDKFYNDSTTFLYRSAYKAVISGELIALKNLLKKLKQSHND